MYQFLLISCLFVSISTMPTVLIDENSITESIANNTNVDYIESKINEIAGVSCDFCLRAIYGVNYNIIRLKKAAEDMIKLDCEALFHGDAEDIATCIRVMVEKIEHYYNRVEPVLDTRHVCVTLRMCAPEETTTPPEKKLTANELFSY